MLRGTGTVPVLLGSAFPAGMVARWTLDDTSAGYVDLIAGRTLTTVGTAPTTAAGIISNAALFAANGNLTTPDAAELRLAAGWAVDLWVYPTNGAATGFLIARAQDGAIANIEWMVTHDGPNTRIRSTISNGTSNFVAASANGSAPLDTWVHVAVVLGGTALRHYINGVASGAATTFSGTPNSLVIATTVGARGDNTQRFTGRIDEPAIWQFGASGDPGAAFWAARYNSGLGVRP